MALHPTVKELVDVLSKFPDDAEVVIHGDVMQEVDISVRTSEKGPDVDIWDSFHGFAPLPEAEKESVPLTLDGVVIGKAFVRDDATADIHINDEFKHLFHLQISDFSVDEKEK